MDQHTTQMQFSLHAGRTSFGFTEQFVFQWEQAENQWISKQMRTQCRIKRLNQQKEKPWTSEEMKLESWLSMRTVTDKAKHIVTVDFWTGNEWTRQTVMKMSCFWLEVWSWFVWASSKSNDGHNLLSFGVVKGCQVLASVLVLRHFVSSVLQRHFGLWSTTAKFEFSVAVEVCLFWSFKNVSEWLLVPSLCSIQVQFKETSPVFGSLIALPFDTQCHVLQNKCNFGLGFESFCGSLFWFECPEEDKGQDSQNHIQKKKKFGMPLIHHGHWLDSPEEEGCKAGQSETEEEDLFGTGFWVDQETGAELFATAVDRLQEESQEGIRKEGWEQEPQELAWTCGTCSTTFCMTQQCQKCRQQSLKISWILIWFK